MDGQQTISEFLGHVSGALAARVGDSPASKRDEALALTFDEAEAVLAEHREKQTNHGGTEEETDDPLA